ncbi:MAG: hypothetical protein JWN70_2032 [Planctomycetaceae bacterium]|nr:hypothetical protein [Planctomycetaceae bacterium]
MTTPEHTMVGIHSAFALGLHRRYGWQSVAMAGIASNVPDWDGIAMFVDMARFESIHRVWGHNFVSILLTSILLAVTQFRWDWLGRIGRLFADRFSIPKQDSPYSLTAARSNFGFLLFFGIAFAAQTVHLPCDMVVSGGSGLNDWSVEPWWPFSDVGYVYPMIPWGDPGPTLILMSGAVIAAKWPHRTIIISRSTIGALLVYLLVRRFVTPV